MYYFNVLLSLLVPNPSFQYCKFSLGKETLIAHIWVWEESFHCFPFLTPSVFLLIPKFLVFYDPDHNYPFSCNSDMPKKMLELIIFTETNPIIPLLSPLGPLTGWQPPQQAPKLKLPCCFYLFPFLISPSSCCTDFNYPIFLVIWGHCSSWGLNYTGVVRYQVGLLLS